MHTSDFAPIAQEFFSRALTEQLDPEDVFRITITSFLDPYNFDVRRVMKCCTHHILPSGHVIPFCAYNTLYRTGVVALPELTRRESSDAPIDQHEIPQSHKDELDRRLAEANADPAAAKPWEEVRARLDSK